MCVFVQLSAQEALETKEACISSYEKLLDELLDVVKKSKACSPVSVELVASKEDRMTAVYVGDVWVASYRHPPIAATVQKCESLYTSSIFHLAVSAYDLPISKHLSGLDNVVIDNAERNACVLHVRRISVVPVGDKSAKGAIGFFDWRPLHSGYGHELWVRKDVTERPKMPFALTYLDYTNFVISEDRELMSIFKEAVKSE